MKKESVLTAATGAAASNNATKIQTTSNTSPTPQIHHHISPQRKKKLNHKPPDDSVRCRLLSERCFALQRFCNAGRGFQVRRMELIATTHSAMVVEICYTEKHHHVFLIPSGAQAAPKQPSHQRRNKPQGFVCSEGESLLPFAACWCWSHLDSFVGDICHDGK